MIRNVNGVLSQGDIEQIHQTSMKLMANIGVEFPDDAAVAVFKQHGFKVDGYMVYFDEDRVMKTLETVPKQFTIHARKPERSVTVGDGIPVFAPAYGAPFLVDHEVGKREPTLDDYHTLVKLAHELPNQDLSGYLLVEPSDVAPRAAQTVADGLKASGGGHIVTIPDRRRRGPEKPREALFDVIADLKGPLGFLKPGMTGVARVRCAKKSLGAQFLRWAMRFFQTHFWKL